MLSLEKMERMLKIFLVLFKEHIPVRIDVK